MDYQNNPAVIERLLKNPARWAVVGLSNNPLRAALGVSYFLQQELRYSPIYFLVRLL